VKLWLVANPTARSGRNKERIDAALDELLARGVDAELVTTEPHGLTIPKVQALLESGEGDVVVSMGGDGTFREVAAAVVRSSRKVPMGMLPAGTANDQGKSFGVRSHPAHLERNVDIVMARFVQPIDAGVIRQLDPAGEVLREDLFFDSAGFGMHPAILVGRNRDREWVAQVPVLGSVYRDQAVYVGATVREVLRSYIGPTTFTAEVVADGVKRHYDGLTDLIVKGTAVYGGIWVPARSTRPDDGRFDVIPLQGRAEMVTRLLRDWKDLPVDADAVDWLGLPYENGCSAADLRIELFAPGGGPVPTQIDGEEWAPGSSFAIEVLPRALPLIVPRDFVPPWSTDDRLR
jgi:diacylglycerol kinase family enzyme